MWKIKNIRGASQSLACKKNSVLNFKQNRHHIRTSPQPLPAPRPNFTLPIRHVFLGVHLWKPFLGILGRRLVAIRGCSLAPWWSISGYQWSISGLLVVYEWFISGMMHVPLQAKPVRKTTSQPLIGSNSHDCAPKKGFHKWTLKHFLRTTGFCHIETFRDLGALFRAFSLFSFVFLRWGGGESGDDLLTSQT